MRSFLVSLLALALVSSAQSNAIAKRSTTSTKSIVELAASLPDLSTLVTALKAANLVETLSGPGPFTVFAPTNEAFAKLPPATLRSLLDPANIGDLQAVLQYHVVSGAIFSSQLKTFQMVKTIQGGEVDVVKAGRVLVNNATVVSADNGASNGVVHIIDSVLMPWDPVPAPVGKSIVNIAAACPDLSTLVTALTAADLVDTLEGAGPFTVFAPTNAAFAKLPPLYLKLLLDPNNKATLVKLLTYHVVAAAAFVKDLTNGEQITTVEKDNVTVTVKRGLFRTFVKINNATVTTADVTASNGVVHIIDTVLMPPSMGAYNIVQVLKSNPDLSTLVTALEVAGLSQALVQPGPLTLFAPNNEAFSALPPSVLASLFKPSNKAKLVALLEYHVVPGSVSTSSITKGSYSDLATLETDTLQVFRACTSRGCKKASRLFVNPLQNLSTCQDAGQYNSCYQAKIVGKDLMAINGVVQVISNVLSIPNKLWFRTVNSGNECGEVNAGPRIPAVLFEPSNAGILNEYATITTKLYGPQKLSLGRCADIGYTSPQTVLPYRQYVPWAPASLMGPTCAFKCKCSYSGYKSLLPLPACKDQPDDPSANTYCSLCGPKYNNNIKIDFFVKPV